MDFKGEDLFAEKNLWAVYWLCITRLKRSPFNSATTLVAFLLLSIYAYFTANQKQQLETTVRSLAELGLSYGTTILGFLIAGFTIFATLTKPELLQRMYWTTHDSGLNYIKVNFYAFIEVFIVYLTFIICCLVIKVIGGANGPLSETLHWLNALDLKYAIRLDLLKKIGFVVFCVFSLYALLALKSFVYNTHHAVMTLIVWGLNEESDTGETTCVDTGAEE